MFAVLHVAEFPLQAVLRVERELAGRAVGLLDDTRRPPVVVACTPPAQAAGVQWGLTSPQAMARCATIVLRTASAAAEADARAGLLAAAFAIAPAVEDTSSGVATIDVAGVTADRRPGLDAVAGVVCRAARTAGTRQGVGHLHSPRR